MNKILFVIISFICIILMINSCEIYSAYSDRVFFTSLFIQIFSIFNIFSRENEPYSLNKIFFLFSLFFFGIAPLLQFYDSTKIWYSRPLFESEYFYTNIIIIAILILYRILYDVFRKLRIGSYNKKKITSLTINNHLSTIQTLRLIVISLISFLMILRSNNNNILSMLIRGGELTEIVDGPQPSITTWLILSNFVRPLSMMCLLYYFMLNKKNYFVFVILFILALITCFPSGMPRFAAAAMYIPVLLLSLPIIRKKNIFCLVFVLGLLLIFPFLDNFRYFSTNIEFQNSLNFKMFLQGHFDSYQNFALIISKNIVTYGKQLMGALFFWVPRSFWPDKPIGSGAYTADNLGFSFDNVSANYFAEGYINFGFLGILLCIILIAIITAVIDKLYWNYVISYNSNYFQIIYMLLLGLLFFFLRGDMMSSFAFTIGFLVSAMVIFKTVNMEIRINSSFKKKNN